MFLGKKSKTSFWGRLFNFSNDKTINDTETRYDKNGNLIYSKEADGTEGWLNENGVIIHMRTPDGGEAWFDDNEKMTRSKDPDGSETRYDENEKISYIKKPDGGETWYDKNGKVVHIKKPDGGETWLNENGKIIHTKLVDGREAWLDDNGKIIRAKYEDGEEVLYEDGKVKYKKAPDGTEVWTNEKGEIARIKRPDGEEILCYGKEKRLIKKPDGEEVLYENGKRTYKKLPDGTEAWFDEKGEIARIKKPDGEKDKPQQTKNTIEKQNEKMDYHSAEKIILDALKSTSKSTREAKTTFLIFTVASFYPTGEEIFNLFPNYDDYSLEQYVEVRKNMLQIIEIALYLYFLADLRIYKCISNEERIKINNNFFLFLNGLMDRAWHHPDLLCQRGTPEMEEEARKEKEELFYSRLISYTNIYKEKADAYGRMSLLIEFQRNLIEDIIEKGYLGKRKYISNPTLFDYEPTHTDFLKAYGTSIKLKEYYKAIFPIFDKELKIIFPELNYK